MRLIREIRMIINEELRRASRKQAHDLLVTEVGARLRKLFRPPPSEFTVLKQEVGSEVWG